MVSCMRKLTGMVSRAPGDVNILGVWSYHLFRTQIGGGGGVKMDLKLVQIFQLKVQNATQTSRCLLAKTDMKI